MSHAFHMLFTQPQKPGLLSDTCINPKETVRETGQAYQTTSRAWVLCVGGVT